MICLAHCAFQLLSRFRTLVLVSYQLRRHCDRRRIKPQRIHRILRRASKIGSVQRECALSQRGTELVGFTERYNEKRQEECVQADGGL